MAFTESSQPSQASSLVSFLDSASKTINGLMDKPNKGNKRRVNHKKFLQKRLQPQRPSGVSPQAKAKSTTSNSAQHKTPPKPARVAQPVSTTTATPTPAPVAPFLHHNSWPQLPNYPVGVAAPNRPSTAPLEPDLDFLIQQLTSTATEFPPQPSVSRPSSDSSLYPMPTFVHHPPPPQQPPVPTSTLESQVILGEQPYGSPYTPSNCSTDDIFEDSYSSPCSSVYSSPAAAACSAVPPTSYGVPPTTAAPCEWGSFLDVAPTPCMVTCSELVTSSPMIPSACPVTLDQSLPTVPQLWDSLVFSDHLPY